MLQELNNTNKMAGQSMSYNKTKLIFNRPTVPIAIEGTELEKVEEYVYLGQLIT